MYFMVWLLRHEWMFVQTRTCECVLCHNRAMSSVYSGTARLSGISSTKDISRPISSNIIPSRWRHNYFPRSEPIQYFSHIVPLTKFVWMWHIKHSKYPHLVASQHIAMSINKRSVLMFGKAQAYEICSIRGKRKQRSEKSAAESLGVSPSITALPSMRFRLSTVMNGAALTIAHHQTESLSRYRVNSEHVLSVLERFWTMILQHPRAGCMCLYACVDFPTCKLSAELQPNGLLGGGDEGFLFLVM